MENSEVNALLFAFTRLHSSMSGYLLDRIEVKPEDSTEMFISPEDLAKLFAYVIDKDPDIYGRFLEKIINADWRLMCNRWWLCMCACYHPDKKEREDCRDTLYAPDWLMGEVGGVENIKLKSRSFFPDFEEDVEYKRDLLQKIVYQIDALRFWADNHTWQDVQEGKMPPGLDTPQAREYLNRAQEAGFLDERYQPIKGFTNPQKKLFAAYCAVACNITERHWKLFEDLWNIKGLQKVKEEQGSEAKAEAVAALFPHGIVDAAKKRFTLLI